MEMEKSKKRRGEKRQHKNIFAMVFLLIFFGGYTFFFTSKFWMPTAGEAERYTKLHQDITWNDRAIRLVRWEYSQEQHLMEVELDISNQKFDGENTYRFTALETNAGPLKVKPILEEMDWVILQIEGIPEKFAEISLRMEMEDDEAVGVVKMYTNVNEVARVNAIEKKDRNGYLAQRYEQEILGYESEIREWNGKIVEAEDKISTIEQEIQEMKAKEEYQTDAQIEDTENMISEAQNEILATEEAIAEYEVDIKERQQRIQNVQLQLNELKQE